MLLIKAQRLQSVSALASSRYVGHGPVAVVNNLRDEWMSLVRGNMLTIISFLLSVYHCEIRQDGYIYHRQLLLIC